MAAGAFARAAADPFVLVPTLLLATFVLEDVATVAAGLLAAGGMIDPAVALAALIAGTVLGDLGLYGAGRWLGRLRWTARMLRRAEGHRLRRRVARNAVLASAAARFVPGTRLPVFLLAGLLQARFAAFAAVICATTMIWTPALFTLSREAGRVGAERLGGWGLLVAAALIAVAVIAPRLARSGNAACA